RPSLAASAGAAHRPRASKNDTGSGADAFMTLDSPVLKVWPGSVEQAGAPLSVEQLHAAALLHQRGRGARLGARRGFRGNLGAGRCRRLVTRSFTRVRTTLAPAGAGSSCTKACSVA